MKNDSDLTAFVKKLDREINTMHFPGSWRKAKMEMEAEQTLFDTCFQKFAGDLDTKKLTLLSEELMTFIVRYNPWGSTVWTVKVGDRRFRTT